MKSLLSFIAGLIFSIGLIISGMVNPQVVIGFLDIFGQWNYALAFVMGGSVLFNLVSFHLLKKKDKPVFGDKIHWPTAKDIDKELIIGSILFGLGWGLVGICPGPGVVNLVKLDSKAILFVFSMLFGMMGYKYLTKQK